ncbi:hypothetical protein [Acuticoccus kandeliae]|uniref:hypothetical protein n=1 Tax=Acuticoccus kandeliae TaxID=2073160 RepID=UPI000D3E085F|nr:hypothetical protein [Acuticoccus kandeliae]
MTREPIEQEPLVLRAFLSERMHETGRPIHITECSGVRVEASRNSISKLCRELIRTGYPPETLIEFVRQEGERTVICFNAAPLNRWAERSLSEGAKGFKVERYRPRPDAAE